MMSSGEFPVIVDSGYSANVLPPSLVNSFYSAFKTAPQLVDIQSSSMFAASCDAEVPSFGIQIGGQILNMAPQTILISSMNATVNGTSVCGLGIQPGVEGAGALGDPFLSSVVAVFDIGASAMRFAQRPADTAADGLGGSSGDMGKGSPPRGPVDSHRHQHHLPCRPDHPEQRGV